MSSTDPAKRTPVNHSDTDPVTRPAHYRRFPVECVAVTRRMGFLAGNAVKYAWRHPDKGSEAEDLRKCLWYLRAMREHDAALFLTETHAAEACALWEDAVRPTLPARPEPGSSDAVWVGIGAFLRGSGDRLANPVSARLALLNPQEAQ